EILSTDAVTTMRLQCFCAAMAETMSIQCMSRPPIRLFSVLVSLGSTSSVMLTTDSLGVFFFLAIWVFIENGCEDNICKNVGMYEVWDLFSGLMRYISTITNI